MLSSVAVNPSRGRFLSATSAAGDERRSAANSHSVALNEEFVNILDTGRTPTSARMATGDVPANSPNPGSTPATRRPRAFLQRAALSPFQLFSQARSPPQAPAPRFHRAGS